MLTNNKNCILKLFSLVIFLFSGLILIFSNVRAWSNYLNTWESNYTNSNSNSASCDLCHGGDLETLNAYGRDICVENSDNFETRLAAVESLDSDEDGTSNLTEIMTSAQPGWTEGDNPVFNTDNCGPNTYTITVPSTVPEPYDPEFDFFIFVPFIIRSND